MVHVTIIIIVVITINQLPIVQVANISVLVLFLGSVFKTSAKEKHKNYNYGILIQILKGIPHPLKDLKWILWDVEDTFCPLQCYKAVKYN